MTVAGSRKWSTRTIMLTASHRLGCEQEGEATECRLPLEQEHRA